MLSQQIMSTLLGKVALVTGGGRGIGKAISLALATAGCDVAVNYVSHEGDARATVDAIRVVGRRVLVAKGDVSKASMRPPLSRWPEPGSVLSISS